jgi:hypothetical protein
MIRLHTADADHSSHPDCDLDSLIHDPQASNQRIQVLLSVLEFHQIGLTA